MRATILVAVLCGCSGEKASENEEPTSEETTLPPATIEPVWYGEIEPIMREHCVGCHQTAGIGPFGLDLYETARDWAQASAFAVSTRQMPPWLLTDDGTCGDFKDSRWMSQEDIDAIVAWADAGAPEGDPALAISDPLPAPPGLERIDAVLETPDFVPIAVGSPEAPNDEYRCFLMQNPAEATFFLTGFEVDPGNTAIVHHVLAMPVDLEAPGWNGQLNGALIAERDGADGRAGWPCFGTAGDNIREKGIPVVWAPGMGAVEFPDGVGVEVREQDAMVVQIHYNLSDPAHVGESDSTRVLLRTEPEGTTALRPVWHALPDAFLASLFYGQPDVIPPGVSAYSYTFTLSGWELKASSSAPEPLWFYPYELVAVMPHMHAIGKQQQLKVIRADGTEQCLADVQDWDFNWQLNYFYTQPIPIEPDDQIEITCTWDSSALTEDTLPGWGTANEMCLFTMMITPPTPQ